MLGVRRLGLAPAVPAQTPPPCYPNCPPGNDEKVTGIRAHGLKVNRRSDVTVRGQNDGPAANIQVTLRIVKKKGSKRSRGRVRPKSRTVSVDADSKFSVVFKVRPNRRGLLKLRACATAGADDTNRSNNCKTTTVRVR